MTRWKVNIPLAAAAVAGMLPAIIISFWAQEVSTFAFIAESACGGLLGGLIALGISRWQQAGLREPPPLTGQTDKSHLPWQINHLFFFNTLHNIAALTLVDATQARKTIEELGEFLRAMLEMSRHPFTLLTQEIKAAETFLHIEQARLGERMRVSKDIAQDCLEIPIPSLVLQPLVENAVRNGVEIADGIVQVIIYARCNGDFLTVEVSDTGKGFADEAERQKALQSVGIPRIQAQLNQVFKGLALVQVTDLAPSGTRISLKIPQLSGIPEEQF